MSTMFCLVSRQSMANVLPVLMFKPHQVVLFATPEEKKSADNLEKLFSSKSINVKRVNDLNAYDYVAFKNVVINEIQNYQTDICLNVTGGTKLMALAAYEVFAEANKRIIYCDTEHQHIISLMPEYKIENLQADISIEDYLLSYGYKIENVKSSQNEIDYCELFSFIEKSNSIKSFVDLYVKVREKLSDITNTFSITSNDQRFEFRKETNHYLLKYYDSKFITFKMDSSDFKSGDWLEYYVKYILKKKNNLEPILGVKIINDEGVRNEIDVMVLKNSRLFLFSCKTGKKDNQFDLYQLETLRHITSGTFGKGIFITANEHSENFNIRAKDLKIDIINVLKTREIKI
ncbi:MAG: DUF1887 family CARF protein [Stygiobacter sp.]